MHAFENNRILADGLLINLDYVKGNALLALHQQTSRLIEVVGEDANNSRKMNPDKCM